MFVMSKLTRDDRIVNIRLIKIKYTIVVKVLILIDDLSIQIFEVSEEVIGPAINELTETNTTTISRCNITDYQLCQLYCFVKLDVQRSTLTLDSKSSMQMEFNRCNINRRVIFSYVIFITR